MGLNWIEYIMTIFCSVLASSGFWAYMQRRFEKKDLRTQVLIGLAHDKIIELGLNYIDRDPQYITQDEYENLHDYLYIPYKNMGGNGSAERIMKEVEKIPIHSLE